MRPEVSEWFALAETDLGGAEALLGEGFVGLAAHHLQQALEKALKGVITAGGERPRKTHELRRLLMWAREHTPDLEIDEDLMIALNRASIEVRYPGAAESLFTAEHVQEYAGKVREAIDDCQAAVSEANRDGG